jgi:hypothetical protein
MNHPKAVDIQWPEIYLIAPKKSKLAAIITTFTNGKKETIWGDH